MGSQLLDISDRARSQMKLVGRGPAGGLAAILAGSEAFLWSLL